MDTDFIVHTAQLLLHFNHFHTAVHSTEYNRALAGTYRVACYHNDNLMFGVIDVISADLGPVRPDLVP